MKFDDRIDQVKMAVLVDVPQFLQNGQGFVIGGCLPCDKRLKRLDDCNEGGSIAHSRLLAAPPQSAGGHG